MSNADGAVIIDSKLDSSGLQKGLQKLGGMASSTFGLAAKGLAAVSAGLVAAGGFAAATGMQFDTAMAQLAATMGTSVDAIGDLSAKAQEMGAKTKFSATEAAEGLNILAMAGLSAQEQIAGIEVVLNLASAGAMSMTEAASYTAGAVKGFGDSMDNAQYYADLMAKGATMANTDVRGLGAALGMSAANAKSYGQSAQSVTVSLLRLAEANLTGEAASTALNRAMADLYTPTKAGSAAMAALGISAYDASGKARDFNEVADELNGKLAGMSEQEANAYKNAIFTAQGLSAFNKMAGVSAETVERFQQGLASASEGMGAAADQAKTQIDSLQGDITIFKSGMEGLGLAVYDGLRAPLREVVQLGTEVVSGLSEAIKQGGPSAFASQLGNAVALGASKAAGAMPKVVQLAKKVIVGLCDGIRKNAKEVASSLGEAVSSAVSGVADIAPKLVGGGVLLALHLAEGLAEKLPELIPKVIDGLVGIIVSLCSNAGAIVNAGIAIARGLILGAITAIPSLAGGLIDAIGALFTGLTPGKIPVKAEIQVDTDGVPETIDVDVAIRDSKSTLDTIKSDLDAFERDYKAQAVDIQVHYKSAQGLIDELATIQSKAGTGKVALEGMTGFSGTLSSMETSLSNASSYLLDISGNEKFKFSAQTAASWQTAAGHLTSIATAASTLGGDLAGLGQDFAEPKALVDMAGHASTLAEQCRGAADELYGLAQNQKLSEAHRNGLTAYADQLAAMATDADTLAAKLAEAGDSATALSPEDLEELQRITQELVKIYPDLQQYVGANGVLDMEAQQVRALIEEYKNLALTKAAGQYVADTAASLASLELERERMAVISEELTKQNGELEAQKARLEEVSAAAHSLGSAYFKETWGFGEFGYSAEEAADAVALLSQYLATVGEQEISNVPGFENLVDALGNMKSPEEILNSSEALNALAQAMAYVGDNTNLELSTVNAQLEENAVKISEAQTQYEALGPAIDEATGALEIAQRTYDSVAERLGGVGTSAQTTAADVSGAAETVTAGAETIAAATENLAGANENAEAASADVVTAAAEVAGTAQTVADATTNLEAAQTSANETKETVAAAKDAIVDDAEVAKESVAAEAENIVAVSAAMIEACRTALTGDALSAFLEVGLKIVEAINQGIKNNAVSSKFSSAAGRVRSAAKSALDDAIGSGGFYSIGSQIVSGIVEGINGSAWRIASALSSAIRSAREAAKTEAQINSPSRVFRDQVGQWIPKGIAVGIDENRDAISESLRAAVREAKVEPDEWDAASDRMRLAVESRSTMNAAPAMDTERAWDWDAIAEKIWEKAPNLGVHQTVNFNRPMQAPDEVARAIRESNTFGLAGAKR